MDSRKQWCCEVQLWPCGASTNRSKMFLHSVLMLG
jgi:hypothetical protein